MLLEALLCAALHSVGNLYRCVIRALLNLRDDISAAEMPTITDRSPKSGPESGASAG